MMAGEIRGQRSAAVTSRHRDGVPEENLRQIYEDSR